MTDTTLQTLLVDELRDIYHAERQLVRALPRLAKAASSPELREALESHLAETEEHVSRLEQAFDMLDETAKSKTCPGMLGIVEEGSEMIKKPKGSALDAGIIAGAQRAEHYEIAAYGSVMAWARALGHSNVAELLSSTLEEEKAADSRLSELAEAGINEAAASEPDGEDRQAGRARRGNGHRMSVGGNGRVRAAAKGRPAASRR
jgi:ferritin-like metal-binding protein YciE